MNAVRVESTKYISTLSKSVIIVYYLTLTMALFSYEMTEFLSTMLFDPCDTTLSTSEILDTRNGSECDIFPVL